MTPLDTPKIKLEKNKQFNLRDYKWGKHRNFTKYTKLGVTLGLEDDAAHIHMGGSWHMPTPEQCKELIGNTISAWAVLNGTNGKLLTSKKDPSKSIFFPASGFAWYGSILYGGSYGVIWSSMLDTDLVSSSHSLFFDSIDARLLIGYSRYYGFSVRGVIG